MYYILSVPKERETEKKKKKQKWYQIVKDVLQGGGLWKELTHGIIDSGNCLHDMKRK